MKIRWACLLPVLPILALVAPPGLAQEDYAPQPPAAGQGPPQGMYPPPGMYPPEAMYAQGPPQGMYPPPGMMPAGYQPAPLPDAYGAYGSMPAGAQEGIPMDAPMDMAMPAGGGGCPYCGGMGCEACGGHDGMGHGGPLANGLLGDIIGCVAPFPDGGCGAVRWYDFNLDYMMLRRGDVGRNVNFTSQGLAIPPNIVLKSSQLDFLDEQPGFRFQAMVQTGPGSDIEFGYYGTFFWDDRQTVTSANNDLFSALSNFGLLPFGGFAETDESDLQYIDYESKFDSFEVNFRCREMAPNCRYQCSCLWGFRYFKLAEDFNYFTQSTVNGQPLPPPPTPAALNYNINVNNNLIGLQFGGDWWMCLLPGLRLGGEFKAGVYGNHYNIDNTIDSTSVPDPFIEEIKHNDVSFLGQADLLCTYRLNYNWTFKGGYQFMFVDGVALAPEQFNATPPNIFNVPPPPGTTRQLYKNDNGTLFYYGWSAGVEFMW